MLGTLQRIKNLAKGVAEESEEVEEGEATGHPKGINGDRRLRDKARGNRDRVRDRVRARGSYDNSKRKKAVPSQKKQMPCAEVCIPWQ